VEIEKNFRNFIKIINTCRITYISIRHTEFIQVILSMCTRKELKLSVSRPKSLKGGVDIRFNSFLALAPPGGGLGAKSSNLARAREFVWCLKYYSDNVQSLLVLKYFWYFSTFYIQLIFLNRN
jgi:hypothetical protein